MEEKKKKPEEQVEEAHIKTKKEAEETIREFFEDLLREQQEQM